MKTLMIIISVLAFMTAVYGINVERLRKFQEYIAQCSQELGATEVRADVIICGLKKDGKVFNANGEFIFEPSIKSLDDSISDTAKLEQAKQIFTKCHNEAVQGGLTGKEQTDKITNCALQIVTFLDKV